MGQHCCAVKERFESVFREEPLQKLSIANISLYARQRGVRVVVTHQVNVRDCESFAQQAALQDAAEESRSTRHQYFTCAHATTSLVFRGSVERNRYTPRTAISGSSGCRKRACTVTR